MLTVENLTTRYGAIEAIHSVSLEVNQGEIVALVGPNGAGKTTIFASTMGLVTPTAGSIRFEGHELTHKKTEAIVRLGLSLVPEHRRLFSDLTVAENLRLGATPRRGRGNFQQDQAALLELFPILKERFGQKAGYLSGGEAQQLAIARALISSPRLLLLDEPTLGLAPILVQAIFKLIVELRERGFTILLAEQNAYQVMEIADRAYVIRNGQIQLERTGDELRQAQDLFAIYLGVQS